MDKAIISLIWFSFIPLLANSCFILIHIDSQNADCINEELCFICSCFKGSLSSCGGCLCECWSKCCDNCGNCYAKYCGNYYNRLKEENNILKKKIRNLENENNLLKVEKNEQAHLLTTERKKFENDIMIMKENYKKNSSFDTNKLVNINNIMVINFMSGDGKINQGIKCLKTETFAEVEEKLYQIYDEFRETNNVFLCEGNQILRFKTLEKNKIKDGAKIILQIFD